MKWFTIITKENPNNNIEAEQFYVDENNNAIFVDKDREPIYATKDWETIRINKKCSSQ